MLSYHVQLYDYTNETTGAMTETDWNKLTNSFED